MPRWIIMTLFLVTALTVWTGLHVYLGWRLFSAIPLEGRLRTAAKVVIIALALAYPLARVLASAAGSSPALALVGPGLVWMGFAAIAFALLVPFDLLVALPVTIARRVGVLGEDVPDAVIRFGHGACFLAALVAAGWGFARAQMDPEVVEYAVEVERVDARLDGYRVAVLSDLHVGELVTMEHLERILDATRSARPDLVVLAGDIVEDPALEEAAFDALATLRSFAKVVAVTGNHELYSSNGRAIDELRERHIPVLRNESIELDGLQIAGVDDPEFLRPLGISTDEAVARAVAKVESGKPVLLAAHQPRSVERAAELGVDVMVSGHTHGGQMPPFTVLTRLAFPRFSGPYRIDTTYLIVGRGAGFWGPPMRLFADPEVPVIVLKSPKAAPGLGVSAGADGT
jgi:predicted MPP superfamily phosphohydrolase